MAEKDEREPSEIQSLNEGILNPDEASLEELEQVSGGTFDQLQDGDCGTNTCGTNSCGTF